VMLDWLQSAGLSGRVAKHLAGGELTVTLWLADKAKSSRLKAVA